MKASLYSKAVVARWMGKRPQDIQGLIEKDGLPCIPVPCDTGPQDRITLHGLHRWCAGRSKGGAFMTVDELAHELELCDAGEQELPGAAEITLLEQLEALSLVVRGALSRGLEPHHAREALKNVIEEWEGQQAA